MIEFRALTEPDRAAVLDMMRVFYASDAVMSNGSAEIFAADVDACIGDNPYLEGIAIFCDGTLCGYAMLAKSFSTEFGRPCVWIEDLYLQPDSRGRGIADRFFRYIEAKYPDALLRLEAEDDNRHAVHVYEKNGFVRFPYCELYRLPDAAQAEGNRTDEEST